MGTEEVDPTSAAAKASAAVSSVGAPGGESRVGAPGGVAGGGAPGGATVDTGLLGLCLLAQFHEIPADPGKLAH